ncbi:Innexin unc-9 [Toxocara canis]|uniref:Innexin n=1 Tax=Toxocara canis TaxID=6265 RepID=A0A0B2VCE3_TOXCA|nr:Innexin unc-9 [Toxocara canis]
MSSDEQSNFIRVCRVVGLFAVFEFEMIGNLGKYLDKLKPTYDDDVIDRCNYLVTNSILFLCAITVAAKQYVGEPLQCWVPAEFKGGWEQYIENYCFVENTYFITPNEELPAGTAERESRELHYYQWVPFILMLQALLFMIPRTVWKTLNWQTGLNIFALAQAANVTKREGPRRVLKKGDAELESAVPVAQHLNFVMNFNRLRASRYSSTISSVWRVYVTYLYIFCKVLNLVNIMVQFAVLNHFLGPQYSFWGIGVLNDLIHGRQWSQSGHFPRVTFCDVNIREIGNVNKKTVQCVLMINMFNEKIFLGIWFWLLIVGVLTFLNLIYWVIISFVPGFSRTFIGNNLAFKRILHTPEELEDFVETAVSMDGVTVLRLISDNAGEMVASEVISDLWNLYKKDNKHESSQKTEDDGDMSTVSGYSANALLGK